MGSEWWDGGAVSKSRTYLANSNLPSGYSTTLSGGTNVYTVSSMSWQGSLLKSYSLSSTWDGGGTAFSAAYDSDLHLQQWTAGPVGAAGAAQQKFAEAYGFSLENLKTVNVTNSLGFAVTSTYNYNDASSAERVTSISSPGAATTDTYVYDRRNRGLIVQRKLGASQAVPQDSYEYDSRNRLISIAHLGAKLETLDYDGAGDLASRTFPSGSTELARYYVGDDLTLVDRGGAGNVGYAHIRFGATRIASLYAKSGAASTLTYYHRDRRNDVVATITSGGAMGVSYRYLPSGAIDKIIGTERDISASELGFIGGLKLSGSLVHVKARAYSPMLQTSNQNGVNDWLSGISVNDAYVRSLYRIAVRARGLLERTNIRAAARASLSAAGNSISEAVQKPIGVFNPTKTNAGINTLAETTGTLGGLGLAVTVASAADGISNAQDPYGQWLSREVHLAVQLRVANWQLEPRSL